MKLVFGKGRVSREDIEREAAAEIQALIEAADEPPAIDWTVYGLAPDVADPSMSPTGGRRGDDLLAVPEAVDTGDTDVDLPGSEPVTPTANGAPAKQKAPRARRTPTGTKAPPSTKTAKTAKTATRRPSSARSPAATKARATSGTARTRATSGTAGRRRSPATQGASSKKAGSAKHTS